MRTVFYERLDDLSGGIAVVCDRNATMMQLATEALLNTDVDAAERVIDRGPTILDQCAALEADTFAILARQPPLGPDLCIAIGCLKSLADLRRMTALAAHVARSSHRRHPLNAVPADVGRYFAEMGYIAFRIANDAKTIVLEQNPDKAPQLSLADDAMDRIHRQLFAVVMDPDWPYGITTAIDVTLLSRYYERFADHAVDIAHRVPYRARQTIGQGFRTPGAGASCE